MKVPKAVSAYMAALGSKGGQTKGASKRRPKAHYERLAAAKRKLAKNARPRSV